ncbi:MAG: DapH/DapD/GlmU-related protein [bacterium]
MKYIFLGSKGKLQKNVSLGVPPRKAKGLKTVIGDNYIIRSGTVIYLGVKIGSGFQSGHNVLIREGNVMGNNTSIGTNSTIEPGNKIGDNVRIHSGCFLENVTLGDNCFVGPNVVFTDDLHPICPSYQKCLGGAYVEDNVSIGANSTILPGVRIGRNSLIAAGALVHKDVPEGVVFGGSPGRVIKKIKALRCIKGFYKRPYIWREK